MKKLFIMGVVTLLSSTIISCTADAVGTEKSPSATTLKEKANQHYDQLNSNINDGPGDEPVVIHPPKKG